MVQVPYSWPEGAVLKEHSKKKHQILRRYFAEYLRVRCSLPQRNRFRLAIVDGFAGGGAYEGGHLGSPLIFLDVLLEQAQEINVNRAVSGMARIQFECLLILNDSDKEAVEILKRNTAPFEEMYRGCEYIDLKIIFLNREFENVYPEIKDILAKERFFRNVFFNLDQCGSTFVAQSTIIDILGTYKSSEIILNFAAESMFTYLSRKDLVAFKKALGRHGVDEKQVGDISRLANKREWRAAIEKVIFDSYRNCAPYVSPFAINNPEGWLYWLLHFANEPKARQVYNDLLHDNSGVQGHFGRSGLKMLVYDPSTEGQEYLFSESDRLRARDELFYDVPRAVSDFGGVVTISEFIKSVSNETPCHSRDLAQAMIESQDLIVRTENGGNRRSPSGIRPTDLLILKPQISFFLMPSLKK